MSLRNINKSLLTNESVTKALFYPMPKEEDWIDLRTEFPEESKTPSSTRKGRKSTTKQKDSMTRWTMLPRPQ